MGFLNLTTHRLTKDHSLPENFDFFRFECFPKHGGKTLYMEIEGGEITRHISKGKRKGRPDYKSMVNRRTFIVTPQEQDQYVIDYESETGICANCMGKKQMPYSWSKTEGTKYSNCTRCNGTGLANARTQ